MNPINENEAQPDIHRDEVLAALAMLLDDREFVRNPASSMFLKFVVEETLAGRGARLKAYTIATLALRRPADFNPQVDFDRARAGAAVARTTAKLPCRARRAPNLSGS